MDFSNLKVAVSTRVGLLVLTIFIFAFLVSDDGFIVTEFILFVLIGLQTISMIKFMQQKKETGISDVLEQVDRTAGHAKFNTNTDNPNLNKLNHLLNDLRTNWNASRKEKEAEFQYLKNIVQHIGIGIITFDEAGNIQLFNSAAKKLLRTDHAQHISDFKAISETLVEMLLRLRTGGRDLLRLEVQGDIHQLAIYAIELTLRGQIYKLVSIQNIQSELEEKEMEAWQNLVRVLTHEIMNSVTPISSLANTVEQELDEQLTNDQEVNRISNEEIADLHLAVQTIKKRSEGLIRFVQDFRNLTQVPNPNLSTIKVETLLNELLILLKKDISKAGAQANIQIEPSDITINADKHMIEQVLINLIKNATQAFDEQVDKRIDLKAYYDDKGRPVISIKDNGNGIDEEALEKIFIPFFTTKKDGSGIGLSLSRQIMRKHQGTLGVKSKADEGTEFFLRF